MATGAKTQEETFSVCRQGKLCIMLPVSQSSTTRSHRPRDTTEVTLMISSVSLCILNNLCVPLARPRVTMLLRRTLLMSRYDADIDSSDIDFSVSRSGTMKLWNWFIFLEQDNLATKFHASPSQHWMTLDTPSLLWWMELSNPTSQSGQILISSKYLREC